MYKNQLIPNATSLVGLQSREAMGLNIMSTVKISVAKFCYTDIFVVVYYLKSPNRNISVLRAMYMHAVWA